MKKHLTSILGGFLYVFINYFVAYIPIWFIRKMFYRMLGMKIGKHSRIMMGTTVTIPWNIKIGENTYINEFSYIDGRGGVYIGNNCTLALYSMVITAAHSTTAPDFALVREPVVINDNVWISARAIVLNGCILGKGCILAANSTVKPHTVLKENTIYSGVPAKEVKTIERPDITPAVWKPWFR
ncbi:MAG: acyltransferase [Synergistaceae bacterium]|jgi:maltose O-acetyltransferase|nr:acyltransferase [Synergistaceae bacterium]